MHTIGRTKKSKKPLDRCPFVWYIILMKDEKNYYVELHANGFKYTNKFSGFDSACAHFSTKEIVGTFNFKKMMQKAIDEIGGQEVAHGWVDYTIGKLFVQDGSEPVSVMSPAWEYHKGSSFPIWKKVLEKTRLPDRC